MYWMSSFTYWLMEIHEKRALCWIGFLFPIWFLNPIKQLTLFGYSWCLVGFTTLTVWVCSEQRVTWRETNVAQQMDSMHFFSWFNCGDWWDTAANVKICKWRPSALVDWLQVVFDCVSFGTQQVRPVKIVPKQKKKWFLCLFDWIILGACSLHIGVIHCLVRTPMALCSVCWFHLQIGLCQYSKCIDRGRILFTSFRAMCHFKHFFSNSLNVIIV